MIEQTGGQTGVQAEDLSFTSACGRVKALAPLRPEKDPYWRVEYHQHGQRIQLKGGRTLESAKKKVALCLSRLDADLDNRRGEVRASEVLDKFLAPTVTLRKGRSRSRGTTTRYVYYADKYIRPQIKTLRMEQLGRRVYQRIINGAPTVGEAGQVQRVLSSFLSWARRNGGYVTTAQVLDARDLGWEVPTGYVPRPPRVQAERVSGESADYLPPELVMTAEQLGAIAKAAQGHYRHGQLLVELSAEVGFRQGEAFAASADWVDVTSQQIWVREKEPQGVRKSEAREREAPKGRKVRATFYSDTTLSGFDLGTALRERAAAARAEREAGTNPEALLFPNRVGTRLNSSNFDTRVWVAACADADIPFVEFTDHKGKERRMYRYTTHSLRDRFATTRLSQGMTPETLQVIGGWENVAVIYTRYVGATRNTLAEARKLVTGR